VLHHPAQHDGGTAHQSNEEEDAGFYEYVDGDDERNAEELDGVEEQVQRRMAENNLQRRLETTYYEGNGVVSSEDMFTLHQQQTLSERFEIVQKRWDALYDLDGHFRLRQKIMKQLAGSQSSALGI
jgi:hypothetical protein